MHKLTYTNWCQKTVLKRWGRSIYYGVSYYRVLCDVITHSQWRIGLSTVSGGWLPVYESVARARTQFIICVYTKHSPSHKPQHSWIVRPDFFWLLYIIVFIYLRISRRQLNYKIATALFIEIQYFIEFSISNTSGRSQNSNAGMVFAFD